MSKHHKTQKHQTTTTTKLLDEINSLILGLSELHGSCRWISVADAPSALRSSPGFVRFLPLQLQAYKVVLEEAVWR